MWWSEAARSSPSASHYRGRLYTTLQTRPNVAELRCALTFLKLTVRLAVTAGSDCSSLLYFMLYTSAPYVSSQMELSRPPCTTFACPQTSAPSSITKYDVRAFALNKKSISFTRPVLRKAVNCTNSPWSLLSLGPLVYCMSCNILAWKWSMPTTFASRTRVYFSIYKRLRCASHRCWTCKEFPSPGPSREHVCITIVYFVLLLSVPWFPTVNWLCRFVTCCNLWHRAQLKQINWSKSIAANLWFNSVGMPRDIDRYVWAHWWKDDE